MDLDSLFEFAGWDPKKPSKGITELVSNATAHWRSPVFFEELVNYLVYCHIPLKQGEIKEREIPIGRIREEQAKRFKKYLPSELELQLFNSRIEECAKRKAISQIELKEVAYAFNGFRNIGQDNSEDVIVHALQKDYWEAREPMNKFDLFPMIYTPMYYNKKDFESIKKSVRERLLEVHYKKEWNADESFYISACFVIWLFREDRSRYYTDLTPDDVTTFKKSWTKREDMFSRKKELGHRAQVQ